MIANSTTLRSNFLPSQQWYFDMLSNSYIKVSYAFIIIGGIRSLKRKAFANLFWLLNTICNLEQSRMPLGDCLNLVLVYNDTGPRYGRTKNKVFLGTVVTFPCILYLLSRNSNCFPVPDTAYISAFKIVVTNN